MKYQFFPKNIVNNKQENSDQMKAIYQLQQHLSINQIENCYSIDFSKDCNTIAVGELQIIKVYWFTLEKIKLINTLLGHRNEISMLRFMLKSNNLVSTSLDGSISIWSQCLLAKPLKSYKLLNHQKGIICYTINSDESLFITGSYDSTMNVWIKKYNQWICKQKLTDHTSAVYGISMNENQNTVISCGYDNKILIYATHFFEDSQLLTKIQTINVDNYGFRLCFINNNKFVFQPQNDENLIIYELNDNDGKFIKTKELGMNNGIYCHEYFPQQYIREKQLLINKNGYHVNIIQNNLNQELVFVQSINFNHYFVFGTLSYNGEYLATWDWKTRKIQIRKYQEN
ncbi:unnamed protein product [Paramecium pentaurelia]|uniref:WD40-repeat-containing domain n=1 Tax=Paramecium pentaurelia TaxID=43138 RepID=A0A8S1YJJ9_9CILI|nr:unnamed protein product [Paramecium pentaurelia]